jgi:hypothetical protein
MRHLLLTVAVLAASASGGAGQVALRDAHLYRDGQLWVPKMLYQARDFAATARQGFDLVMPKAFSYPRETTVAPGELAAIHAAGLRYCFSVANPILFDEAHGIRRPWDDTDLAWILPILNADYGLFATVYTAADGRQFLVAVNVREDIPFNDVTLTRPQWHGLADGSLEAVSLFGGERVLLAGGVFRRSFGPATGDVYEARRQAQ